MMNLSSIDTLCYRIAQLLQENDLLRERILQLEGEAKTNTKKTSKGAVS